MGSCCPSTLELREHTDSELFEATLFTPHIGHECSLTYLNLSKGERAEIAGKIQQGISFNRILDDIRGSINMEQSVERIHLLSRQDLRNIEKEFLLKSESQFHKNDAVSVDLWVQQMSKFTDCSPVLFYKPQGMVSESEMFKDDDFVLIIMTSAQESLLKQFGNKKICIDSTHGTNQYDFQLTSLLVVDEYGEGIPVAFLLSNRVDTNTLTHFFNVLKSKVGSITCEVFMSDDAPEFYNAWTNVMERPEHRLLCIWHVDRNWRKQLKKVQGDQTLKVLVYKSIRMVMETTDEDEFCKVLDSLLNELLSTENTKLFGEYFQEYYAGRPECWAYCYRRGLGINTNMYLESMHKTLKFFFWKEKKQNEWTNVLVH
ncbi:uncharacterized protein [Anabrus simplex]|uniref:uncharacterized protein n=1 Tax=Anabrus simplex TaxID=316456 RepID=UPI0035A3A30B